MILQDAKVALPAGFYNRSMNNINNREHPRFEVPAGKWVKLWKRSLEHGIFQMIDISQGGMSFVSLNADEFKRGDKFVVVDIKDGDLTQKILGIVRYVKVNVDLGQYTDYKVGIEFLKVA